MLLCNSIAQGAIQVYIIRMKKIKISEKLKGTLRKNLFYGGCSGAETKTAERVRKNIHRPHRRNYFLGDPTKKSFTNFPCINDLAPSYCSSISNTWKAKQFQFFFVASLFFFFFSLILVDKV